MMLLCKSIAFHLQLYIFIFTHIMSIFRIYRNRWIIHVGNSFREKKWSFIYAFDITSSLYQFCRCFSQVTNRLVY